jgi:hypothetical protein
MHVDKKMKHLKSHCIIWWWYGWDKMCGVDGFGDGAIWTRYSVI